MSDFVSRIDQTALPATGAAVEVIGLHKSYDGVPVLRGIDLEVSPGEVVVLIGPSGGGKSTLLRCLNRLVDVDEGTIRVGGDEVTAKNAHLPEIRRRIGFVAQHFNLYPLKTALGNVVEAPITVLKLPRAEARERGLELLRAVGLADKADAYPRQLSGGQQQRVAIARALAMRPDVILFDEPTSALDPELTGEVLSVMTRLSETGITMIIASHEMQFARQAADRIVMIDGGLVIENRPPEDLFQNATNERTRKFLSRVTEWQ